MRTSFSTAGMSSSYGVNSTEPIGSSVGLSSMLGPQFQGDCMSSLRIYGIARTRAFRALWIAMELGLDYEHFPIEIGAAGARAPEFLKINPNGRLPFIDDHGVNIWSLHAVRLPAADRDATKRDEALKVIAAPFKVLDAAVGKQPYLLGNDFTVADLNVAAVISRAIDMDLSGVPNLKAWLTRCLDRPAARQALALKTKADNETPAEVTQRIAKLNRL